MHFTPPICTKFRNPNFTEQIQIKTNLNFNLCREIPRNLCFSTWLILGMHFDWNLPYNKMQEVEEEMLATHCNALQRTASHCNALHCTALHCNALQCTATHCNALQRTATHCNALQRTATHCNALHHTASHCNALHRTASHCNALQHHPLHTATHLIALKHTASHYSMSNKRLPVYICTYIHIYT